MTKLGQLSRREQQIMEILYRLEKASASDVVAYLPDAPSNSSVRTHLRKLLDKGLINYEESGLKYLYFPKVKRKVASKSALAEVVKTFFADTPSLAVNQLLDSSFENITDDELKEIEELIRIKKAQRNN